MLCDVFREVELAGNHVAVIDKHLEVNMWSAPWIPAGIDRIEVHLTLSPGELRSAQERLALCRTGLLTRITGNRALVHPRATCRRERPEGERSL